MSSKLKTRALLVLARLYDLIEGDNAPSRIDLRSPIALVHDTSREIERGSGVYLLAIVALPITADATTFFDTFTPEEIIQEGLVLAGKFAAAPPDDVVANYRCWVLKTGAKMTTALNLTGALLTVLEAGRAIVGTTSSSEETLFYSTAEAAIDFDGTAAETMALMNTGAGAQPPRLIRPGSTFKVAGRSSAGGGVGPAVTFTLWCWIGVAGSAPAGSA